jgi:hypothetical protein
MGNWHISIEGVGVHHNANLSHDADRMAAVFVQQLIAAGHSVSKATFTYGGAESCAEPNGQAPAVSTKSPLTEQGEASGVTV